MSIDGFLGDVYNSMTGLAKKAAQPLDRLAKSRRERRELNKLKRSAVIDDGYTGVWKFLNYLPGRTVCGNCMKGQVLKEFIIERAEDGLYDDGIRPKSKYLDKRSQPQEKTGYDAG